MAPLPRLAPRPKGDDQQENEGPIKTPRPQSVLTHSESEWAALYPEIERLYVHERRKLRYIMQLMETRHGFKATTQMYKKRLAKWEFQKYNTTKRSSATAAAAHVRLETLQLGHGDDDLKLLFLTSVRMWSIAYFELHQGQQQRRPPPLPTPTPTTVEANEISFAFKLVIDLLDRGHGELAGRMARKSFLLVEDLLTLDGPALLWNLLELMHNIVVLGHTQLFRMLLAHLDALVAGSRCKYYVLMPETHPLSIILGLLRRLTFASDSAHLQEGGSSSLPSLLEQAWVCNAEMLLDRFDPELIPLYWCISWDSCSIDLPPQVVDAAVQSLGRTECGGMRRMSPAAREYLLAGDGRPGRGRVFRGDGQNLAFGRCLMSDTSPENVEMLHASSVAALRAKGGQRTDATATAYTDTTTTCSYGGVGDTTTLLGVLAGMAMAKILDEPKQQQQHHQHSSPSSSTWTTPEGIDMTLGVPRIHDVTAACVIRVLMDPDLPLDSFLGLVAAASCANGSDSARGAVVPYMSPVDRVRMAVALREYAKGEADPQVVREMWLLEDALVAAGEECEARGVRREALDRLERYVRDIPVACV